MAKTLNVDILSQSSIRQLCKELKTYQEEIIQKTKTLVKRLSEQGIKVAEAKIGESPLGQYVTLKTDITEEKAGCKAILVATGATRQSKNYPDFQILLAIEFGAGIHYNQKANPNAEKFGLGVGTFPGQTHAFEEGWSYWDDETQKWCYSHGVKATMPMYHASIEMITNCVKTARDVFEEGGGSDA